MSARIYILPNFMTSLNVFSGVFSIVFTLEGRFTHAAVAILIALVFDLVDGVIARLQRASSQFGIEFDSMADLISFGVAPMVLLYRLSLSVLGGGRIGLGIACLYTVSAAVRLARFNLTAERGEKPAFTGLPSPAAAGFLAGVVILLSKYEAIPYFTTPLAVVMLTVAYLMVSPVKYPASSAFRLILRRTPFIYLTTAIFVVGGAIFFAEEALFAAFAAYVGYGPGRRLYCILSGRPETGLELIPVEIRSWRRRHRRRRPWRRRRDFDQPDHL